MDMLSLFPIKMLLLLLLTRVISLLSIKVLLVSLANYYVVVDQVLSIDSSAINHITQNTSIFLYYSVYTIVEKLHLRNGLGLPIQYFISAITNNLTITNIYLTNILHVPNITNNLLCVYRLLTNLFVLLKTRVHGSYCSKGLLEMDFINYSLYFK